jgi:uncharacterized RDD family membrane protein YckC
VTKTCLQCGAVLPLNVRACNFCDSSAAEFSSSERLHTTRGQANLALNLDPDSTLDSDRAWRGELAQRVRAYRVRQHRLTPDAGQSQLPFGEAHGVQRTLSSVAVDEHSATEEDFSFTIAIGRHAPAREGHDGRMEIDVSVPAGSEGSADSRVRVETCCEHSGLYPVASIEDRRLAALVDTGCLLFAYGGFLALFGSLGGQFTVSKLSAAVYVATFAIVYLQYFTLFTIFGGTTPGMMLRNLQVMSFSGEPPSPRQMLLRSAGYILSAGTFFLGFAWACWDEDALTWHDRLSRTYLSAAETHAQIETPGIAHSR